MFLRRSYGFRSVGVLRLLLVWNKVEKLEWLSSIFLLHPSHLKRMLLTALTLCTRDKMVELLSVCEVAFQVVFEADDSGRGSFMSLTLLCVFWTCHSRCITLLFLCKIKGSLDHFQNVLLWLCVTRNNLKGLFVLLDFLSKPLSCRRCQNVRNLVVFVRSVQQGSYLFPQRLNQRWSKSNLAKEPYVWSCQTTGLSDLLLGRTQVSSGSSWLANGRLICEDTYSYLCKNN